MTHITSLHGESYGARIHEKIELGAGRCQDKRHRRSVILAIFTPGDCHRRGRAGHERILSIVSRLAYLTCESSTFWQLERLCDATVQTYRYSSGCCFCVANSQESAENSGLDIFKHHSSILYCLWSMCMRCAVDPSAPARTIIPYFPQLACMRRRCSRTTNQYQLSSYHCSSPPSRAPL